MTLPLDQWLATGRVTVAVGTKTVHQGEVFVRAWYFERGACSRCSARFIRSLSDGGAQSANLYDFPTLATASFSPTTVPCGTGTAQGSEHDIYTLRRPPAGGHLDDVQEDSGFTGCGSQKGTAIIDWTAVDVPLARPPKLAADSARSATVAAFHTAANAVCTNVNKQLSVVTTEMVSDMATLKAAAGRPNRAAADAAARLAKAYPQLLPIMVKNYATVPQPPAPLAANWHLYGQLQHQELPEIASALVALSKLYTAASNYERTGSPVSLDEVVAEQSLAGSDINYTSTLHTRATALAQQLGLPPICTRPPALAAIGGYLLP
jgi:hypothetical protein